MQVYFRKDRRYQYEFVNITLGGRRYIRDGQDSIDIETELPLRPLESHIHPLHVVMNAYPKILVLKPLPNLSTRCLEAIKDICDMGYMELHTSNLRFLGTWTER